MALKQATQTQVATSYGAVLAQGFHGVLGAAWRKTAVLTNVRAKQHAI
jgi:hypothetical protein